MDLEEMFEKHHEEFIKFERIPEADRRSQMWDVCAFIYLQEKFGMPDANDAVACATHDEIHLGWDHESLKNATEEDIIYLIRCGVRYSDDGLCMFV